MFSDVPIFASRSSTFGCRRRALAGMVTVRVGWSMKPLPGGTRRGPTFTTERVCDRRVVERTITGVSNRSDISKASAVKSCASCASEGSRQGTPASLA